MDNISKPSINRIAKLAGIKSMSDDCYDLIKNIMFEKLDDIIKIAIITNSERQTKTLMVEDIYNALNIIEDNNLSKTSMH
jgi:histone H3/H4